MLGSVKLEKLKNFGAGESFTNLLRETEIWTLELHTSKRSELSSEGEGLSLNFWWGSKKGALREQAPIDSDFRKPVHALLKDVYFRMKCSRQNFRELAFSLLYSD